MRPYVFQTSLYSLRWENVAIVVGIVAGVWLAFRRAAPKGGAYQDMILDLSLYLVLAGIAGARIWEMAFTWNEYVDAPWERFAIWNGGMSIQGGILGGLTAVLIFAWRRRLRVWQLLDVLAPPVILGQAIGRVGCFLSGDAFGRPIAQLPWLPTWLGVTYARETPAWYAFGATPLVPAEVFEMVLDLVILAFLLLYKPRRAVPGRVVLTYAILYSAARFALEFLRADSLRVGGLKAAQVLSIAVMVLSGLLMASRYRTSGTTNKAAG